MSILQEHFDYYADSFKFRELFRKPIFESLKQNPELYFIFNDALRDDREVLEAAIKQRSDCYLFASERLRAIPEIYLAAVAGAGEQEVDELFEFAECWLEATPLSILSNLEVQLKAMVVSPVAISHATDEVRSNPEYLFAVADVHGAEAVAEAMVGEFRDKFIPDHKTRTERISEEEAQAIYDALKAHVEKERLEGGVRKAETENVGKFKI